MAAKRPKPRRTVKQPLAADVPNPPRPDLTEADQLADRYMISQRFSDLMRVMGDNGMVLRRIASTLEKIEKAMNQPAPVQTGEPADRKFLSGRWHRRSGDVYARVAEPGSPNARDAHGDDQTRDI